MKKSKQPKMLDYKYKPDRWLIIKLEPTNGEPTYYRVFGTWGGSYLHGQSWQMNSGIESIIEKDGYYYFKGASGSVYACYKESYGFFSYGYSVLSEIVESNKDKVKITTMPEDTNWMELKYV